MLFPDTSLLFSHVLFVKGKAPGAVQGEPVFPHAVWPGMFGTGNSSHIELLPSAAGDGPPLIFS
jgi:hypothetical protein